MTIINDALLRMADGYFKTDLRGRYLYYPWSRGRGYVLDSREDFLALRAEIAHALAVILTASAFMLILMIFEIFFLPAYLIVSIMIGVPFYALGRLVLYIKKHSLYWPRAKERMTYVQSINNNAQKSPPFALGFAFAFFATTSVFFAGLIADIGDRLEAADAVLSLLIGSMCVYQTITLGWMIFIRLTGPKN